MNNTHEIGGSAIQTVLENSKAYKVETVDERPHIVPKDPGNRDYQTLQAWLQDGGVTEPMPEEDEEDEEE